MGDGVLFGEYDGEFQLRAGVKTWLKWAHEHFEIVWLAYWAPEKIRTILRVAYCEKFLKNFPDRPVQCADWSIYSSKVEWLNHAIPRLHGRQWYWIDDEVSTYKKEIESLKLPEDRCIEVSKYGARALEKLRDRSERLEVPSPLGREPTLTGFH